MDKPISRNPAGIEINAADVEHIGSLVAGTLLLATGLRRGGALGLLFDAAGAALLYRGQKGYRRLYDLLGIQMPLESPGVGLYNVRAEAEIEIDRSPAELYRIWRNFENLPVFMSHLVAVYEIDDTYSRWVARGPLGMVVKWDARIINDVPDQLIAWESLEGSGVDHKGTVRFDPTDNGGTRLKVVLRYDPPAEHLGTWVAKFFGKDPQTEIEHDLRRFQAIMNAGRTGPQASMM